MEVNTYVMRMRLRNARPELIRKTNPPFKMDKVAEYMALKEVPVIAYVNNSKTATPANITPEDSELLNKSLVVSPC